MNQRFTMVLGLSTFMLLPYLLAMEHTVAYLLVLAALLCIFVFLSKLFKNNTGRSCRIIPPLIATYYFLLFVVLLYKRFLGLDLDPLFIYDFRNGAFSTLRQMFGLTYTLLMLVSLIGFWCVLILFWKMLADRLSMTHLSFFGALTVFFALPVLIFISEKEMVIRPLLQTVEHITSVRKNIPPVFPTTPALHPSTSDNVFILQLDSINGMAANGMLTVGGKLYDGNYIPHMREIASRDGIYFPLLWNNETNTNRAQEVILCGIVGNIGSAFSDRLQDMTVDCLPTILSRAGYTPIVFRSDDLQFENEGSLFRKMGFKEIHYEDIMKEGDTKYGVVYDDCTFYERAFEYLHKNYSQKEKLFVYIEVSSHHVPFDYSKPQYEHLHPFATPANYFENFLNSMTEQDYCVQTYYDNFKQYSPANTHLFMLADHSWPMLTGEYTDDIFLSASPERMLTSMVYVPPAHQKESFRVGSTEKRKFGQDDLIPTILELLSNTPQQNSIVFALRENAATHNYDDCHLLTQAYHWSHLAIARGQTEYFKYNVETQNLYFSDLAKTMFLDDVHLARNNLSFSDFMNQYYCERNKQAMLNGGYMAHDSTANVIQRFLRFDPFALFR